MPYPYGTRNISNVKIDACSPNAVAAFIHWLCHESGWQVRDRATGTWVGVRPEHVCILFRRFTNFGTDLTQEYVRCLEARGIAHLLVGSKSFHRREEVGTLRTALRAIEWPDDELSVFAVLRGSLYAVLDDTLLRFKNAYGRFHPMMELPETIDSEFASHSGGSSVAARTAPRAQLPPDRGHHPRAAGSHARPCRLRVPQRRRARSGQRLPAYRPGAQLRSGRRGHLISRLRGISGKRIRWQRHQRGAGARAGGRRRAVDDRPQGQGPGIPRGHSGGPHGEAHRTAGLGSRQRPRDAASARSACYGARRGNCSMPRRPKPRPTRRRRCVSPMWRRPVRAISWWWPPSAKRSEPAAG